MNRLLPPPLCLSFLQLIAQDTLPVSGRLLSGHWPAAWVGCPGSAPRDYGVYHFRRRFRLDQIPRHLFIHISADNRYRLFVNGTAVCSGPARGDLGGWYFETVDLAPFLKPGVNSLAALVWNMGVYAPVAQISNQTAFVLQADRPQEDYLNTPHGWKVLRDQAYSPCSTDNMARLHTYMVIGPGDRVDGSQYPWGWEQTDFSDTTAWQTPYAIASPAPYGYGTDNQWTLVPRNIPLFHESLLRLKKIRRSSGAPLGDEFLDGTHPLTVAANTQLTVLLDQEQNTVAYPELLVSGGKGATVRLTYAEALFAPDGTKGNRNQIEGKQIKGNEDIFLPDGGSARRFRPLWLRTYRYVQLEIQTADSPLVLEDMYGSQTGYPFETKARFSSSDPSLQQIWDIGWHTAQLCAGETYFDCPYYEQLQYEGDTRIQSLISLYMTGDDRLFRKAIQDFFQSRVPEGLTQGRYPSNRLQVIPPFSLFWVSMLYDYWMHQGDSAFLAPFLHAAAGVLEWYENHLDPKMDMLGPMKWWNFVDWNTAFENGTPDGATDGHSSVLTLQYAVTLQQAAALFAGLGKPELAAHYQALWKKINRGTFYHCFDPARVEMANTPEKQQYSQHASILGVLSGAVPPSQARNVMEKVLKDTSLSQATFYFRFYLTRALKKAGMADLYFSQLKPWRGMVERGLTTFAENPDPTRSDCHAWSSSPNYDFLATLCGIVPAAPGFEKVRIEPALGELLQVCGSMPSPKGIIEVCLERKGEKGIQAAITLPKNLTGQLFWKGKTVALHGGTQEVRIP